MTNGMTSEQRNLARHALGLDGNHRKRSYRNYYTAPIGTETEWQWQEMVRLGWAKAGREQRDLRDYSLTYDGAKFVIDKEAGESLDKDDFTDWPRG